jgi:large subunit ribosomal protein L30
MRFLEIVQVRSAIGRHRSQQETLMGLGLGRIGRVKWVQDTPSTRGMIAKVPHLVRINNDPTKTASPQAVPDYDEGADAALMRELAFAANNIVLESYTNTERNKGKTPDFKLVSNGVLCGFCEMKSPRDDYVFALDQDGIGIRRNLPHYRKLGSHIRQAAAQFDAVNPDHCLPNLMIFVNHAPAIERRDLHATVSGLPVEGGLFVLPRKLQGQVCDAARRIDLFIWIDAHRRTCQEVSVVGATHRAAALALLGIPNQQT